MNKLTWTLVGALAVSLASLSACSKKTEEPQTAAPVATPAPVVQQLLPEQATAAQQANTMPQAGGMPMQQMNSAQQAGGNSGEGKILQSMHASSYTYMQVDTKGKQLWIAANAMQVKTGDTVRWNDGALMKNFTSTALHRTFDEILFVSAAEVAK